MENLCVRFHVRGRIEYDGKEWNYIGGKSGCSSVPITNLSIEALKNHLHDYMVISHEDLEALKRHLHDYMPITSGKFFCTSYI
jgi:hypothetical protein